jgi:hypothetical protein
MRTIDTDSRGSEIETPKDTLRLTNSVQSLILPKTAPPIIGARLIALNNTGPDIQLGWENA